MRPRLRQRLAVLAALVVGVAGSVVTGLLTAGPAAATDNGLSIRPAMGWSSWSFVRRWPDEAKIKAQASAMVSSGLASHGYVYINLDDFWQLCDGNGFVVDGFGRWVATSWPWRPRTAQLPTCRSAPRGSPMRWRA